VVDAIIRATEHLDWNIVAAIDALGFALGAAVAARTGRGLVVIRKAGKLPRASLSESYAHYTGGLAALELPDRVLSRDHSVLIIDEWIETGATAAGAIRLVKRTGANIAGIATLHCDLAPDHAVFEGTPVIALNQL
jgi:adenine phosphoribosyltransferase